MFTTCSDALLSFAAPLLLIGFLGVNDALDDRAFDQTARSALALPQHRVRAVPYERGGVLRHIDYDADLTFTTVAGKTFTAWHVPVTQEQRDDLVDGRQLTIQYLPGDPASVRLAGWQHQPPNTRWVLLALGALASAGFWFQRKREQRSLLARFGPRKFDGPLRPGDPRP